jgi:hypothetical protein
LPPASFIQSEIVNATLGAPNVTGATVTSITLDNRQLSGPVDVTDASGNTQTVNF